MSTEYSLLVRTNSYTGNTDSFISAALFGYSDGRNGGRTGEELFKKFIGDIESDELLDLFEDVGTDRETEYGMKAYQINNDFNDGYNTLELFVYEHERLPQLVELWKKSYGGAPKRPGYADVELISFHLKKYVTTTKTMEL